MDSDASSGHSAALGRWWGQPPQPQASPSTDVMNQLCRVCGEPAAGFHFGAFTCEGCKSFFGRTYNNLGSITECKNNGECVINKKNRTACKACRLRKCLLVGMSKSGSRYGRRSNWFKIHCLLQEQQQVSATGGSFKDKVNLWTTTDEPKDTVVPLNNNTSCKDRERSPSQMHPALPPSTYSAEAAAAIWAARSSFLPVHPAMHPFLPTPFPGFPGSPHHQRGFLLPFMSPTLHQVPTPPPASTSPSPSRSSTYSHSPGPEEKSRFSEEQSLAKLRGLGPVQDKPMDLTVHRNTLRKRRSISCQSEESDDAEGTVSGVESVGSDRNDENFNKRKIPLDLSKSFSKSIP